MPNLFAGTHLQSLREHPEVPRLQGFRSSGSLGLLDDAAALPPLESFHHLCVSHFHNPL